MSSRKKKRMSMTRRRIILVDRDMAMMILRRIVCDSIFSHKIGSTYISKQLSLTGCMVNLHWTFINHVVGLRLLLSLSSTALYLIPSGSESTTFRVSLLSMDILYPGSLFLRYQSQLIRIRQD